MVLSSDDNKKYERLEDLKREALRIIEELPQLIMVEGKVVLSLDSGYHFSEGKEISPILKPYEVNNIKHASFNDFNFQILKNEIIGLKNTLKRAKASFARHASVFQLCQQKENAKIDFDPLNWGPKVSSFCEQYMQSRIIGQYRMALRG